MSKVCHRLGKASEQAMIDESTCYTYMLECADGTFYTGWSKDIEQRLIAHNLGKGAKYTRTRLPVRLFALWNFASQSEAMKFEYQLKKLSRAQKLELVLKQQKIVLKGKS